MTRRRGPGIVSFIHFEEEKRVSSDAGRAEGEEEAKEGEASKGSFRTAPENVGLNIKRRIQFNAASRS